MARNGRLVAAVAAVLLLAPGCATGREAPSAASDTPAGSPAGSPVDGPAGSRSAAATPPPSTPPPEPEPEPPPPEPRRSFVTIEALGLRDFPVRRYAGSPDDAAGTAIQDAGDMASPRGRRGGVGPGEVGNFIVTGHRLSSSMPLRHSPSLERGDRIRVRSGDVVHVYEVRRTRWTSFRSPASLAAQRAAVPGRPGVEPTRAMITLSTCATLEDHAAGNYWADEHDNPEHRIDKIGVLVATRSA